MSEDSMRKSSIYTCTWILLVVVLLLQLVMMYTFMKGAKSSTLVERRSSGNSVLPDKKYSLALTPPMGWNSWNVFHCAEEFNEVTICEIADAMVTTGLKDAGYQYINLDDCWQYARDNTTGEILPNPVRFPSGMKALADYVHGKGLKFGLYTDVGSMTCAKWPGSLGYEATGCAEKLLFLDPSVLDQTEMNTVYLFKNQLHASYIGFTANGIFPINSESILIVGSSIVTYTVVAFTFPTSNSTQGCFNSTIGQQTI